MSCTEIREQLPALLYGDVASLDQAKLEKHLADCTGCRREYQALKQVRRLLDRTEVPPAEVDLPRLYYESARRELRRARRWRIAAFWMASAAALLLACFLGLRLEARMEPHQLVLRWREPAPVVQLVSPSTLSTPPPRGADEQCQLLSELIHALAEDVQAIDQRHHQDTAELWRRLQGLQQQYAQHWAETDRNVAALFSSLSREKRNEPTRDLDGNGLVDSVSGDRLAPAKSLTSTREPGIRHSPGRSARRAD